MCLVHAVAPYGGPRAGDEKTTVGRQLIFFDWQGVVRAARSTPISVRAQAGKHGSSCKMAGPSCKIAYRDWQYCSVLVLLAVPKSLRIYA